MAKKQSHVPAARQQNAVLTRIQTRFATATMQRTNHYTTTGNHWLTARNMANGGHGRCREGAKNLLWMSKKDTATSHWHLGKQRSRQDSNLRGENPMDFKSIALTTRPRLRECQLPNEANAGFYISSCGGGFFDADPGNAQHFKFPRSLTSVSLSSFLGMK